MKNNFNKSLPKLPGTERFPDVFVSFHDPFSMTRAKGRVFLWTDISYLSYNRHYVKYNLI
jgi:hypothetical protein